MSVNNQTSNATVVFLKDLIAGGASGIAIKTLSAPLERIKLLLQTQHINSRLIKQYNGPMDCMYRVYSEEGFLSFWRGNMANLYRYLPNHALNFAFKDKYKGSIIKRMKNKAQTNSQTAIINLVAAGAAGATSLIMCHPFDVARTKLAADVGTQLHMRLYTGTFDCLMKSFQQGGVAAVYAGFAISLVSAVLFRSFFLGGYDTMKHVLDLENSHVSYRFLTAQLVTAAVGTACYPLDTVKRRLMMNASNLSGEAVFSIKSELIYRNAWDCFRSIVRDEGVRGLFRGATVNLLRSFGGAGLLVAYDEIQKLMHDL